MSSAGSARLFPQLLKVALIAVPPTIAAVAAASQLGLRGGWLLIPLIGEVLAISVLLLLDINGSAAAVGTFIGKARPMGVDYSRSMYASSAYARFIGLMVLGVAAFLIATALAA